MIIVTGASGQFGRALATLLVDRAPGQVILTSRKPEALADFAARGATVRFADFDDPASLDAAFVGGTRMMLISTARVGTRVGQHINAMTAAVKAGVRHIAYTSLLGVRAPGNPAIVKLDHLATEEALERSGAAWTFLRDSQYAEAVAGAIVPSAILNGGFTDNAGDGRIAFVSREDCVACAAAVLTGEGHENRAYDMTGPELLTIEKGVALAAELIGHPLPVTQASDEAMFAAFDALGVPRHASDIVPSGPIPWSSDDMVTFGQSIREGFFDVLSGDVERLAGRPATPLIDVLRAFQPSWPAAAAA